MKITINRKGMFGIGFGIFLYFILKSFYSSKIITQAYITFFKSIISQIPEHITSLNAFLSIYSVGLSIYLPIVLAAIFLSWFFPKTKKEIEKKKVLDKFENEWKMNRLEEKIKSMKRIKKGVKR